MSQLNLCLVPSYYNTYVRHTPNVTINGTRRLRINTDNLHKNIGGHESGEERRGDRIGLRVFRRQLSELLLQIGTLSHLSYEKKREQNKQNRALKTLGNSGCCKRKKKKKRPVWHAFGKNLSSMGSSISVHNSSVEVTEDGFSMLLLLCQITCGQHDPCSYCWYRIFMSRFLR